MASDGLLGAVKQRLDRWLVPDDDPLLFIGILVFAVIYAYIHRQVSRLKRWWA